jgi:hypothetical protein
MPKRHWSRCRLLNDARNVFPAFCALDNALKGDMFGLVLMSGHMGFILAESAEMESASHMATRNNLT